CLRCGRFCLLHEGRVGRQSLCCVRRRVWRPTSEMPRLTGRSVERPESQTIRHVRRVRLFVLRVHRDLDASSLLTMLPVINSAPDGPHRDGRRLAGGFPCGRPPPRPPRRPPAPRITAPPPTHPGHSAPPSAHH